MTTIVRSRSYCICLLLWSVYIPTLLRAQAASSSLGSATREYATQGSEPYIKILYTGKLMGYFRIPDWQIPLGDTPPPDVAECQSPDQQSKAARDFNDVLSLLTPAHVDGAILVGTGDNFSPEIEAREFCFPPKDRFGIHSGSIRKGKEFFLWNDETKKWLTYEDVKHQSMSFKAKLSRGEGTIPEDNVAEFLTQEGYAAIVPGRHDFYFGPERLRELARLLATRKIPTADGRKPKTLFNPGYGVQMLGANLVIETTWKTDHAALADKDAPPRFIPRFPTASDLVDIPADAKIEMAGFPPGGNVYPWYVGPTLRITVDHLDVLVPRLNTKAYNTVAELREAVRNLKDSPDEGAKGLPPQQRDLEKVLTVLQDSAINLCEVTSRNYDQQTHTPDLQKCPGLHLVPILNAKNNALSFDIPIPLDEADTYTLKPGANYRFCITPPKPVGAGPVGPRDMDNGRTFCMRMSVYRPFFQHPWKGHTREVREACLLNQAPDECPYQNPEPYVLMQQKGSNNDSRDVAIFGVVDPHLGDNVGLLNVAWQNQNSDYRTVASAKDPAEALSELLAYFNYRNREKLAKNPNWKPIRVLLAEMSAPQAAALASRLDQFEVVVSEADEELSKPDDRFIKLLTPPPPPPPDPPLWLPHLAFPRLSKANYSPRALVVPSPYFRPSSVKSVADIGYLEIQAPAGDKHNWTINSGHEKQDSQLYDKSEPMKSPAANDSSAPEGGDTSPGDSLQQEKGTANFIPAKRPANFWLQVNKLLDGCQSRQQQGPRRFVWPEAIDDRNQQIQLLTLCLMQKETGADVALLQKRDFFSYLPKDVWTLASAHRSNQELLDRIIWKGDFLTLIYVPGSALKKVLDQSKAFGAEEKSILSLSDERGRDLAVLGAVPDSDLGEYIINGVPLDPNKLYGVATSDFLSAGDTGYPDLASSQVKPPIVPTDFGQWLKTISSVVCRKMTPTQAENPSDGCLDNISTKDYFDQLALQPADPRRGKTPTKQLELWSVFHHPPTVPGSNAPKTPEDAAQGAVEQRPLWDFSLTKLSLGVATVGHNGDDFDVKANFSGISSPGVNTFSNTTLTSDFQAQLSRSWSNDQIFLTPAYTYNVQYKGQPDDFNQLSQIADLGSLDLGYIHTRSGRRAEHFDVAVTGHFETPLTTAFNAFTLKSTHKGAHGEDINDQLRFHVDRSYTALLRPGIRWKRRVSSIEFGPEWGHEWKSLTGIDVITNGNLVPCAATATQTISSCLKNNAGTFTPKSLVATTRNGQDHTGTYWKINLTIPFHPRFSYVLTDSGDWFFVRYGAETSASTLFRDVSQHQLKFNIIPSLSIGPEFDILLYRNKPAGTLQGHFLFQDQLIMKAQWNFDLFNARQKLKQVQYAPSSTPK